MSLFHSRFNRRSSSRIAGSYAAPLVLLLASNCESVLGITPGTPRAGNGGGSARGGGAGFSGGSAHGGGSAFGGAPHGGAVSGEAGEPAGHGGAGPASGAGRGGGAAARGGDTAEGGDAGAGNGQGAASGEPGTGGGASGTTAAGGSTNGGEGGEGGESASHCKEGDKRCDGNVPLICEGGIWNPGTLCRVYCLAGECKNPLSCASLEECRGETSCCHALEVPGGTFIRDFDNVDYTDQTYTATLSPFLLDEFEVTVGRFRNFVDAYPSITLEDRQGRADYIEGDHGWKTSYPLPATQADLKTQVSGTDCSWTDDSSGDEQRPINCVDFFLAYAFCIWDGGRLPTEAEWNFAAAGGKLQRAYPWSDPPGDTTINADDASFYPLDGLPPRVGSYSGNGLWGHADLAGGVYEWNLDYYVETYPSADCHDCVVATGSKYRSLRGGAYQYYPENLRVAARNYLTETLQRAYAGFRCVHDSVHKE